MSVFQQVIGKDFSELPAVLKHIHGGQRQVVLRGDCDVQRGQGILVALMAFATSLPESGNNVPLTVTITRDERGETWARNFGGHEMRSRLWAKNNLLAERLGLVTLLFELKEQDGKIEWRVCGARLLGVPLPTGWFAKSQATEQCIDGRYTFDVRAELPLLGSLVHYQGWLSEHA